MPWWGWMILGAILFGAELFLIDAQFFLVFIGASAIIVGFAAVAGAPIAPWGEWLLFAALSISTMVFFRRRLYSRLRGNSEGFTSDPSGETILIPHDLAPGESDRVEYRGTTWLVVNAGAAAIDAGTNALIDRVDGTTIKVIQPG